MITVSKRVEFDAGHRVPDHLSKCRSPHGHRYVVEATVAGPVQHVGAETGMVKDFAFVKDLLVNHVHDPWDHAFLVYEKDGDMRDALDIDESWKVAVLDRVPTAENLAALIAIKLVGPVTAHGCTLETVTVWETPTCCATWRA